ncbi:hypothetical protein L3V79_02710 [Thiotrichales bacterium 19S9-12]|nr:hypothetical protein [Thiotrichales bacterium 19S9-11]MCF6811269.1 hypothetical protein [Thiotrichales bacterium 19S9-12]
MGWFDTVTDWGSRTLKGTAHVAGIAGAGAYGALVSGVNGIGSVISNAIEGAKYGFNIGWFKEGGVKYFSLITVPLCSVVGTLMGSAYGLLFVAVPDIGKMTYQASLYAHHKGFKEAAHAIHDGIELNLNQSSITYTREKQGARVETNSESEKKGTETIDKVQIQKTFTDTNGGISTAILDASGKVVPEGVNVFQSYIGSPIGDEDETPEEPGEILTDEVKIFKRREEGNTSAKLFIDGEINTSFQLRDSEEIKEELKEESSEKKEFIIKRAQSTPDLLLARREKYLPRSNSMSSLSELEKSLDSPILFGISPLDKLSNKPKIIDEYSPS